MSTISIPASNLDKQQMETIMAFLNALKIKFELTPELSDTKTKSKHKKVVSLSDDQKDILDERRSTSKKSDFIPWNKAKKQLKFKSKK